MKRFLSVLLALVLVASVTTLYASAYEGEDSMVLVIDVPYVENAKEILTMDGDLSDWDGYTPSFMDAYYMTAWAGSLPEDDWQIALLLMSDSENLYVAYMITDTNVNFSPAESYNAGSDSVQFGIDLMDRCEYMGSNKPIFYSWGIQDPNSTRNNEFHVIVDAETAHTSGRVEYTDREDSGFRGMTKLDKAGDTVNGWSAEFSISWEMLKNDLNTRLADELEGAELEETKVDKLDFAEGVYMDVLFNYIDYTDGKLTRAFGTGADYIIDWNTASTCGLRLQVKDKSGEPSEDDSADTDENATEAATEAATDAVTEAPTDADTEEESKAPVAADTEKTTEAATDAAPSGCSSTLSMGLSLIATVALAGVMIKKKND